MFEPLICGCLQVSDSKCRHRNGVLGKLSVYHYNRSRAMYESVIGCRLKYRYLIVTMNVSLPV